MADGSARYQAAVTAVEQYGWKAIHGDAEDMDTTNWDDMGGLSEEMRTLQVGTIDLTNRTPGPWRVLHLKVACLPVLD